jgi:hypothetical protein
MPMPALHHEAHVFTFSQQCSEGLFFWDMMGCHWVIGSDYQLTQLHIPEEHNLQFCVCNVSF